MDLIKRLCCPHTPRRKSVLEPTRGGLDSTEVTSVRLPIELVELIIDNLRGDRVSLSRCSIICKSWFPRSRARILSFAISITREKAEQMYILLQCSHTTLPASLFTFSMDIPDERRWPELFFKNLLKWKIVTKEIRIHVSATRFMTLRPVLETAICDSVQTLRLMVIRYSDEPDRFDDEPIDLVEEAGGWPIVSGAISRLIASCSGNLLNLYLSVPNHYQYLDSHLCRHQQPDAQLRIHTLRISNGGPDEVLPILLSSGVDTTSILDLRFPLAPYLDHDGHIQQHSLQKLLGSNLAGFKNIEKLSLDIPDYYSDPVLHLDVLHLNSLPNLRSLHLFLTVYGTYIGRSKTLQIQPLHLKPVVTMLVDLLSCAHSSTLLHLVIYHQPYSSKFIWDSSAESVTPDLLRLDGLLNDGRFPNLTNIMLRSPGLAPLFPISNGKGLLTEFFSDDEAI
ncbi:hypothetical protein BDP27DRAFT_1416012 [Rhodocollybia butyracea]|uniref:F-box domain-containing protein n=1 Tax=Rhodocollybia butyracea TaxID=206335 RepID=A0A9P5UDU3_9AGAR|nr:hypothetical protein BDP27DRAFT_1416012 [Rhodocollybia butyracea]